MWREGTSHIEETMTHQPATPEDFEQWLEEHLGNAKDHFAGAASRMAGEFSKSGGLSSSAYYVQRGVLAEEALRSGIDAALAQCNRAKRVTKIDYYGLRKVTGRRLAAFRDEPKRAVSVDQSGTGHFTEINQNAAARLDKILPSALRYYDVGLLDPGEPRGPLTMTNTVSIGTFHGMLQQGTVESTQSATGSFNADNAAAALDRFVQALNQATVPSAAAHRNPSRDRNYSRSVGKENPINLYQCRGRQIAAKHHRGDRCWSSNKPRAAGCPGAVSRDWPRMRFIRPL
jgi:hypothetical protein